MSLAFASQHGEDEWIAHNLKPAVGTFCEVGAYDGVLGSNTLYFERTGWRGILVEPVISLAQECAKSRRADVWCCAAGPRACTQFFINPDDPGAGGLKRPGNPVPVIVRPLWELLVASRIHKLDLLSIDTEGTELEVWDTLGPFLPTVVIVEYRTFDEPPQDKAIVEKLAVTGYREVHRTACNLILTR